MMSTLVQLLAFDDDDVGDNSLIEGTSRLHRRCHQHLRARASLQALAHSFRRPSLSVRRLERVPCRVYLSARAACLSIDVKLGGWFAHTRLENSSIGVERVEMSPPPCLSTEVFC